MTRAAAGNDRGREQPPVVAQPLARYAAPRLFTGYASPCSVALCSMRESVYVRHLNGPLLLLGIIVGLAVVAALLPTMVDSTWAALLFGVLVIGATVACIAMRVKVVVSDDGVTASVLGVFQKRIPLDDITCASIGPETGLKEGAGPRVVDGAPAYIVSGPTVRIDHGASSFIASAQDPGKVVADIQSRLALSAEAEPNGGAE